MRSFQKLEVAGVSARMPRKLLALRALSCATAEATEGADKIEETLRWGEPAYLTAKSKPAQYAMHLHCQTDLVEFEPPRPAPAVYVAASLTFHRNKQKPRAPTPRGGESERARQRRRRSTTWGE